MESESRITSLVVIELSESKASGQSTGGVWKVEVVLNTCHHHLPMDFLTVQHTLWTSSASY